MISYRNPIGKPIFPKTFFYAFVYVFGKFPIACFLTAGHSQVTCCLFFSTVNVYLLHLSFVSFEFYFTITSMESSSQGSQGSER